MKIKNQFLIQDENDEMYIVTNPYYIKETKTNRIRMFGHSVKTGSKYYTSVLCNMTRVRGYRGEDVENHSIPLV